jgi:nucleotide-binding universal stress UspA family protein
MTKVLIALDDSPISLRAAREAGRLFPDAEFLVVNVTRRIVPWVSAGEFGTVYPLTFSDLTEVPIDEEVLFDRAHIAGIDDAEFLTLKGDPASVICSAAEEHDVDAVVVGSHDKGVLRRLLDPSVAQAVVQGTYRPVLVVSGTPLST